MSCSKRKAASLGVALFGVVLHSLSHSHYLIHKCNFKFESTEEATQKVEQTFGCAPVDDDNIVSYCTTSTGSNIICRGNQSPQQRYEKQHELRKQELREELEHVKERQERLLELQQKRHRQNKELHRVQQRQVQLQQQKKRLRWQTQLLRQRQEEHRRIRQEREPCP
jgi:beta-glucosidase-like glycosyl hydrolase